MDADERLAGTAVTLAELRPLAARLDAKRHEFASVVAERDREIEFNSENARRLGVLQTRARDASGMDSFVLCDRIRELRATIAYADDRIASLQERAVMLRLEIDRLDGELRRHRNRVRNPVAASRWKHQARRRSAVASHTRTRESHRTRPGHRRVRRATENPPGESDKPAASSPRLTLVGPRAIRTYGVEARERWGLE